MRKKEKNSLTKLHFDEAWEFPEEVEKHIANILNKKGGLWLHAPIGRSKIKNGLFNDKTNIITIDINLDLKPDIVASMFYLPFKDGTFDGAISDPLWYLKLICKKCGHAMKNATKGMAYPQRRHLSYSIRQVLKPGGLWLFNGLWNPRVKGFSVKKTEFAIQNFSSFRNVALFFTLQKVNQQLA